VAVVQLPFELHPEIPRGGVVRRRGPESYARIADECARAALAFNPPQRVPNTRLALEAAELVRLRYPAAFEQLNRSLFEAHFVEGGDIGDPTVVYSLVEEAGADPEEIRSRRQIGEGRRMVDSSMAAAREADVTGTPAWLLNGSLLIPGAQPRDLFERVVRRLSSRHG